MSKRILIAFTVMLFSGLAFTSCKKEKQNVVPTTAEYLTGKWMISWFAYDENMNKKLDEQEKEEAYFDEQSFLFFNADGTGHVSSYYYPDNGVEQQDLAWSLSADEKTLIITIDYEMTKVAMEFKIIELNLDNCVLESSEEDFGVNITTWTGLVKQRQ